MTTGRVRRGVTLRTVPPAPAVALLSAHGFRESRLADHVPIRRTCRESNGPGNTLSTHVIQSGRFMSTPKIYPQAKTCPTLNAIPRRGAHERHPASAGALGPRLVYHRCQRASGFRGALDIEVAQIVAKMRRLASVNWASHHMQRVV